MKYLLIICDYQDSSYLQKSCFLNLVEVWQKALEIAVISTAHLSSKPALSAAAPKAEAVSLLLPWCSSSVSRAALGLSKFYL